MKRWSILLLDGLLAAAFLCGCRTGESLPDPTVPSKTSTPTPSEGVIPAPTPTPDPAPQPTPTPTPQLSPTPTPSPVSYDIQSFLPLADLHIRYESSLKPNYRELYVEYTNSDKHALQHRVFSNEKTSPYVTVTACEEGKIVLKLVKETIGFTYNFLSAKPNTDEVLLMEPVTNGNSWAVEGGTRTITDCNYIIDVQLGSYRAVEVTTEYYNGAKLLQYYVPDFGLIAEHRYENGQLVEKLEAVSQDTDQGFTQLIRFYFAQPTSDSVKYENRSVTIKPNASMGSRFVNQFRSVPSGSGLVALDGVSIKSIKRDSKGYIHVDFGSSLTSIVSSVGRATESLIITALTNTFCDYYQTDRFYITVAGEQYESPYRFLMEGEYFSPNYNKASVLK